MATHDYVISNASGAAVRADLNNALAAIVSNNSNATEPSTTYSYMLWADNGSSPPVMKLRNAANDGWVTLFQLDGEWSTLAVEDGTAAAPSLYFKDSGTDTGFFSSGTDEVAISTGGIQRATIDSSGRLLVGTSTSKDIATSTQAGLQVASTAHGIAAITTYSSNSTGASLVLGKSRGATIGSNTVVQSGDVIGDIRFAGADGNDIQTNAARITCEVDGTPGANDMPGRLVFSTTADGAASPTERMRIRSSTNTEISIVGTPSNASNTGAIDFRTSGQTRSWVIATDTTNFYIADADFSNYAYLAQNPTSWQFASDARLKENITDLDYGIDAIKQIKAKRFNFIGDSVSTIGFIAQELKEVIPEAVSGEEIPYGEDDTPQEKAQKSLGIGKETLVPVLVKALQEAIDKIETLEAKVAALESA